MRMVVGISKLSPMAFNDIVRDKELVGNEWRLRVFNKTREYTTKNKYLFLFLSISDLLVAYRLLQGINCIGVVFDCKQKLKDLSGVVLCDTIHDFIVQFKKAKKVSSDVTITYKATDVIGNLINQNKSEGILHTYNNTLYSITSKDLRELVKTTINKYLNGQLTLKSSQQTLLTSCPKRGKAKDAFETFINLLATDQATQLRNAIVEVKSMTKKNKSVNFEDCIQSASKKHGVAAYDMRYMLAINRKE